MRGTSALFLVPILILSAARPLPAAEPPPAGATSRGTPHPASDALSSCLRSWEQASSKARPLTDTQQRQIQLRHEGEHSGQELAVACQFCGPVRASDLNRQYEWTSIERNADHIRLTARPRDTIAGLFFRQLRLTLDATTYLPRTVEFADRAGHWKTGSIELANCMCPVSPPSAAGKDPGGLVENRHAKGIRLAAASVTQLEHNSRAADSDELLRRILRGWRQAMTQTRMLEVPFKRCAYDNVFGVASQSTGMLYFRAPDRFRVDWVDAPLVDPEARTVRRDDREYKIVPEQAGSWIFARNRIFENHPSMDRGRQQATAVSWGPYPAERIESIRLVSGSPLATSSVESLEERYNVTLVSCTDQETRLILQPRRTADQAKFKTLTLTLDTATYATKAIEMVDAMGGQIVCIEYEQPRVNRPWRSHVDPFQPLAGENSSPTDSTTDPAAGNE